MKKIVFLTLSLLFSSQFLFAQTNRAVLNVDARTNTTTLYVPLEEVEPFLAFSLSWSGAPQSFLIRSSADLRTWTTWETLRIDTHGENTPTKRVSILHFIEKEMRYIQLTQIDPGQEITALIAHFFNPGITATGENTVSDNIEFRSFCPCPQPVFEDRLDWCPMGTCPEIASPTFTNESHLIVHHSATSNTSADWAATVRSIWDFHVNTNGWDDVGYNWLIDPNGVLYEGRGDRVRGAHFCGTNANTMGVCMLGDFTSISPTNAAKATLAELLAWKSCDRALDPLGTSLHNSSGLNLMHISGHRDGCSTACPGNTFYPQLNQMRNDVVAFIDANCSSLAPPLNLMGEVVSNTQIDLEWEDETEGESGFELERSVIISSLWQPLATLDPNTTSYSDTDLNPDTKYFYRLRAVNETDTSAYSNVVILNTTITSVQNQLNNSNVQLFPNPAKDELLLQLDHERMGVLQLRLSNTTGQILQTYNFEKTSNSQQFSLSLELLPAGLYFLQLTLGSNSGIFKIVKK